MWPTWKRVLRFKGTNLRVLLFAILVASVELNVNSTAVIIGVMLISPLMGPIVGGGFGAPAPAPDTLLREVQTGHPTVRQPGLSRLVQSAADSLRADTAVAVAVRTIRPLPAAEVQRLTQWLTVRAGRQPVRLLVEEAE